MRVPRMLAVATAALGMTFFLRPGLTLGDVAAGATACPQASANAPRAAALRPTGMLLSINFPHAGEDVETVSASESFTAEVDYWGPKLVENIAPYEVSDNNYHLVFLLDADAASYLGTLSPIPRCDARIVHTAQTSVTFDHVLHGGHVLWVVLAGTNDVPVNPPVATSVTFVVH